MCKTALEYLELVKGWEDPNPKPIIVVHENFYVVRDDLLGVGSKVRFLDYLIKSQTNIKEFVFGGCPATGYAQISLPYLCSKYGKKAVLFMAKRKEGNLHPYQVKGMKLGAEYKWVNMGMLTVTKKRAKDYAEEDPETRMVLPLGLEHPTAIASIIKVAQALPIKPHDVWVASSSGTIARGLSYAFPEANIHAVSVGHTMTEREIGRCILHKSPYKFDKPVTEEDTPPYPSAPTYDAKVWSVALKEYDRTKINLIWNVGA